MNRLAATRKGVATRDALLDHAYAIAAAQGLEGLSLGELARLAGMSKSGVFAHFGSREDLQLAVLDHAAQRFTDEVLVPALRAKRGRARLRAIFVGWLDWVRDNRDGCPILSATVEYDGRPGILRERIVALQTRWRSELRRAVQMTIDAGELPPDTDAAQVGFELFGLVLAYHHDARLFEIESAAQHALRAFDRLLGSPVS